MNKVEVLDKGYVMLIDSMGSDLDVVRAARVSYDAAWRAGQDDGSDKRLINYLWKNKHTSPFEAVEFKFEVKAPIFVFRQWHRHRTWSYNEVSARYKEIPEEFYLPDPKIIGKQSKVNKQARDVSELSADERYWRAKEIESYESQCAKAFDLYRSFIRAGWPRELARSVLPVSTYSLMHAKIDLLNLLKFLSLRDHAHAQHEIRVYAQAMKKLIRLIVPVCVEAWESTHDYGEVK